MDTLIIHLKKKKKKAALLSFLKTIDYIEVEEKKILTEKEFIKDLLPVPKKKKLLKPKK
jgi:hypothetical protein